MASIKIYFKAGHLLVINPKLFFKYLFYRTKRLSSKWKHFDIKNFSKKFNKVFFTVNTQASSADKSYIRQLFFDCYQLDVLKIIKKYLKLGDTFIDVGANIGYFTAIGASLVGKTGEVHAFEPVPKVFKNLTRIKDRNPNYKIILNNCAVGDFVGTAPIMIAPSDTGGGSSMIQEMTEKDLFKKGTNVSVVRLDRYIKKNKINNISLIKIDVEGYEFSVLKGLEKFFKNSKNRPIIVCEIATKAYSTSEQTRSQLIAYMEKYGYRAYNIANERLPVNIAKFKMGEGVDVVFIVK